LKVATGAGWSTALTLGLVPFIVGDILKSVVATGLLPVRSRLR
ncbi:BioY family transporter, partial [Actinomyces oris]